MMGTRKRKQATGHSGLSKAQLDELVDQATVDCDNESEQVTGLYTMIENAVALPFKTTVLGVPVSVERAPDCPAPRSPTASPPPAGTEWIAAYRHWVGDG